VGDEAFLSEIAADPDAAAPYLVYADALQQRGDPRGELIVIQHALETASPLEELELRRREADLFDAHAAVWLGEFRRFRRDCGAAWRRGFCHRVRLPAGHTLRRLQQLLTMPCAQSTVVELLIPPMFRAGGSLGEVLDRLVGTAVRRVRVLGSRGMNARSVAELRAVLEGHQVRSQLAEAVVDDAPPTPDVRTIRRMHDLLSNIAKAQGSASGARRIAAHAELVELSQRSGDTYFRGSAWQYLPARERLRECTALVELARPLLPYDAMIYELPSLHAAAGDLISAERCAWQALAAARWHSLRSSAERMRAELRMLRQRRGLAITT
jgi:uncharacterized protein (TIGR02996 family)